MRRSSALAMIVCLALGGCYYFPDFRNSPNYRMPVAEVVNQIKCDIYGFLLEQEKTGSHNFSLAGDDYATVELTLNTTAFGDVKFSKIDTNALGLGNILAVGSATKPFPSLEAKASNLVSTKVTVNVSQNPRKLVESCTYGGVLDAGPNADRALVNRIRLREWLQKTFESGDRIHRYGPSCDRLTARGEMRATEACGVSLESMTLTTKFELLVDMSAGVLALAKLIPVVVPATAELSGDYYHQIQIIFHGNNAIAKGTFSRMARRGGPRVGLAPGGDDTATAVLKELRAIRDATILNAHP